MSKHALFKAALVGALAFGGIGTFAGPASADCTVNTGICNGNCTINTGTCTGNCSTVNAFGDCGTCNSPVVNTGVCRA